ncbi:MAG: GNAT family N-acetyltransferase [Verrucomicrobiae bacterium]|nr:GNAT family N-acetyltransferase [Verrucomicrobiae bacterium]
MNITRADECDLERILEIQRAAYRSEAVLYDDFTIPPLRQTLDELRAEFRDKVILKAVVDQKLLGSVRVVLSGDVCLLGRLIVDPTAQGQGIGSVLLSAGETVFPDARSIELFTGSKSVQNINFYGKRGYVRIREEVVSPKLTLVYMRKSLLQNQKQ